MMWTSWTQLRILSNNYKCRQAKTSRRPVEEVVALGARTSRQCTGWSTASWWVPVEGGAAPQSPYEQLRCLSWGLHSSRPWLGVEAELWYQTAWALSPVNTLRSTSLPFVAISFKTQSEAQAEESMLFRTVSVALLSLRVTGLQSP